MKKILALGLALSSFLSASVSVNANSTTKNISKILTQIKRNLSNQGGKNEQVNPSQLKLLKLLERLNHEQLKPKRLNPEQPKKSENFMKKIKKYYFLAFASVIGLLGIIEYNKEISAFFKKIFSSKSSNDSKSASLTNQQQDCPDHEPSQFHSQTPSSQPDSTGAQFPPQNLPQTNPILPSRSQTRECLGTEFTIVKQLEEGIFSVKNLYTGMIMCIKKINFNNDDTILKNLKKKSEILISLQHPNIVQYFQSFVLFDHFCIVMNLVDGRTLKNLIENNPLPEQIAIRYFVQILSAIEYCHSKNILHGYIKPDNILLTKNNIIKLMNFGISKNIENNPQRSELLYRAPEMIKGENYSFPVDIWSLGCVLYEMLNADKPFTFMDDVLGNPIFLRTLNKVKTSDEIQRLINEMLDENPKTRITIEQIVKSPLIAKEIINSRMLCFYKYLPA
ncbi:MAG: serine/threonine-protein kinase [Oscillospiraceae bacterium]|jgi:hypothetical protein|nr:serine/threonine-protein kinase [Oscillospiraceae bacterium]